MDETGDQNTLKQNVSMPKRSSADMKGGAVQFWGTDSRSITQDQPG